MSVDFELNEIHWMMDMFNTIDVGLVVLDRKYNICVWNGHFYALGLVKQLGIEETGVVRIGCMHYNSIEEIDLLFNVLEGILRKD